MKKWVSIIVFLCLLVLSFPAYAANSITLEELDLTVALPDDYIVFTRDLSNAQSSLAKFGLTPSEMLSLMRGNNFYLVAYSEDGTCDITIAMDESGDITSLSNISEKKLKNLLQSAEEHLEAAGCSVNKVDLFNVKNVTYIRTSFSRNVDGDTPIAQISYSTIYNGKCVVVTIESYSGKVSEAQQRAISSVVESIQFHSAPQRNGHPMISHAIMGGFCAAAASFVAWILKKIGGRKSTASVAVDEKSFGEKNKFHSFLPQPHPEAKNQTSPVVCTKPFSDFRNVPNRKGLEDSYPAELLGMNEKNDAHPALEHRHSPYRENEVSPPPIRFCHKCGFELLPGSVYCSVCGAKIQRY